MLFSLQKIIQPNTPRFNAAFVFFQKLTHTGLTFLTAILLARITGTEGYGAYAFAISWVTITTLIAMLGLDKLVIRELARYLNDGESALVRGMIKKAGHLILAASAVIAVIVASVSWAMITYNDPKLGYALLMAIPLIPLLALIRLRQSALEGRKMAGYGNFPELVVMPGLLIIAILGGYLFWESEFTAYHALMLQWGAAGVALVIGQLQLRRYLTKDLVDIEPEYKTREWVYEALPLIFISGLYVINANIDTLMVGFLIDSDSVGIYAAANKITSLIVFIQLAVNKTLSPDFSSLYHQNKMQELQAVVSRSVRWMSLASLFSAIVLIAVGPYYLWLYGTDFSGGYIPLIILCSARALTSTMGSVSFLLIMTGNQSLAARNVGIAAILNLTLNLILIPMLGITGAAVSTAVSLLVLNLLQTVAVISKLQINPTIFGKSAT